MIGRFIGLVRALAPFAAGSSGMRYGYYLPFSVLGTGLWAAAFGLIGYFAAQSLDAAAEAAGQGTLLFGIAVGVIVGIVVAVRFLREPENRRRLVAGMERRAALRPLLAAGRRVAPPARFLWARVTPGQLGLEFTTLLAVLAVSVYVVVAYTVVISGDPGPTAGDRTAFDVAGHLRTAWVTDAAKIVTALGSAAVNLPLAALAALLLAARRRWAEAAVLVAAVAIIYIGVDGAEGRDRAPAAIPSARRRRGLGLPQRARRPRGDLPVAGAHPHRALAPRDGRRLGAARPRDRAGGAGRAVSRLPAGPLPERRQRRLGAGGGGLRRSAARSP